MPAGSAPGERRGGRQKGAPNKAKAAEATNFADAMKAAAFAAGPDVIDSLTPAQTMRLFAREAIKAGYVQAGMAWMKDCAPYFDRRADGEDEGNGGVTIQIKGGLPD
jgi:hypothetical protein